MYILKDAREEKMILQGKSSSTLCNESKVDGSLFLKIKRILDEEKAAGRRKTIENTLWGRKRSVKKIGY